MNFTRYNMIFETKVYKKNQTTIPAEIRKKFNIKPDDIVEWEENENGEIMVSFRKKISFKDAKGSANVKEKTNAVELERDLYRDKNSK